MLPLRSIGVMTTASIAIITPKMANHTAAAVMGSRPTVLMMPRWTMSA